jgi:hypothetical protein
MSSHSEYTEKIATTLKDFDDKYYTTEFNAYLQSWKIFLKLLADRAGEVNAIEAERWIYRHYISSKYSDATHEWWNIFCTAKNIPDFLEPVIQEIHQIISVEELLTIKNESRILYSRYYKENNLEDKKIGYDPYSQAHHPPYYAATSVFYHAFVHIRVNKVMQILARLLDASQIDLLTQWIETISADQSCIEVGKLCGKELITTIIPFSNFPSILT